METKKAKIIREEEGEAVCLVLHLTDEDLRIVLTDDNPNNIKDAFNKLILTLKKGEFAFELDDEKEDLYHHICVEYITQLNSEIQSVFNELSDYGLLEADQDLP
jgi:hypothetical protein